MRTKTLEQNTAHDFAGLQIDQLQKLRNGNMTIEHVKWFNNLSFDQREKLSGKRPRISPLAILSKNRTPILDAVDGTETLATANDVFLSGILRNFRSWNTNKPDIATPEIGVQVYRIEKDATFAQMFDSLGTDLDKLCLTQHQIKNFCKKHRDWLTQNGQPTFFLFKVEGRFFIAHVIEDTGGLYVYLHRFNHGMVWSAEYPGLVVVPEPIT